MPIQTEKERFRSFAERYIVARASVWKPGEEDTAGWVAVQDAKRLYKQIAKQGEIVDQEFREEAYKQQAATNQAQTPTGSGPYTPHIRAAQNTLQPPVTPSPPGDTLAMLKHRYVLAPDPVARENAFAALKRYFSK